MAELKVLPKLSTLIFTGTKGTDAGLVHLRGLNPLTTVGLVDTAVTSDGVKKLRKALPACHVVH
jgi:hypothetical protein